MTRPTYVYSLPLPRHCCTSAYAYDGEHAIPKHILRDSEIEMHAELCTPVVFSGLLVWSRGGGRYRKNKAYTIHVEG